MLVMVKVLAKKMKTNSFFIVDVLILGTKIAHCDEGSQWANFF